MDRHQLPLLLNGKSHPTSSARSQDRRTGQCYSAQNARSYLTATSQTASSPNAPIHNALDVTFHPVLLLCKEPKCGRQAHNLHLWVNSEGQVELVGFCPFDHQVSATLHFASLVARSAGFDSIHRTTQAIET